jgi:hypothetical protein
LKVFIKHRESTCGVPQGREERGGKDVKNPTGAGILLKIPEFSRHSFSIF